ncbi:MAG: DUF4231 domain-containing protein [Candidatus Marithrix sp.]
MTIFDKIPKQIKNLSKKSSDTSTLTNKSYQTIVFPNKNSAQVIKVSSDITPEQAVSKLPLTTPISVIMISGDAQDLDESIQQRLIQLFSRGLARTAINLDAVIMDSGKTSDLTTLIGQCIADRGYKSPLIGVATSTQVSYPEQEENAKETIPLESNHTHFVLVDDDKHIIEFKYRLGAAMSSQKAAVMILVGGEEEARAEVLQAVRMGWPIITITGTGKLADEIAELSQNPPDFIPNPELAEIIADGKIIQFSIKDDVKELDQLIYRQLGGDNTLKLAWQQFAIYDKNATQQQKWFHRLQFLIILFAVLGTTVALLQATLDLQIQQSKIIFVNRSVVEDSCYYENSRNIIKEFNSDKIMKRLCLSIQLKELEINTMQKYFVDILKKDSNVSKKDSNVSKKYVCNDDSLRKVINEYSDNSNTNIFTSDEDKKNKCEDFVEKLINKLDKSTELAKSAELVKKPSEPRKELLKIVLETYENSNFFIKFLSKHKTITSYVEMLIIFLQWVIVAIPIIITLLIGIANHFSNGKKWIWLRSSAENLKSEIFRYRTKTGNYHNDKEREIEIAEKVKQLNSHLMQTEVKMSAMKKYDGNLPPQYSVAENDDGFTMLSPERYIKMRLEDQLSYYQDKTTKLEYQWTILQWCIYGLGGIGTLLAARGFELWIAFTTGLVAAFTTYLGYKKVEERLTKYNQAAVNLTNILNWWTALSTSNQMKQNNIDKLISSTETALSSEFNEWVKQMQETMVALKEQEEESKKEEDKKETSSSPSEIAQPAKTTKQDSSINLSTVSISHPDSNIAKS